MLTGTQPFTGEQPVHVAFQHVHDDIPAPSTVVSGIPRELDSLVTWAAARSVEQRPAGALDLLRAVHELQHSLPDAVMDTRPRPREDRSEEHTSELQSRGHLVCRLLLEK